MIALFELNTFPANEALDGIHLIEVGPFLVGPDLFTHTTAFEPLFNLRMFKGMIQCELFEPLCDEGSAFFRSNEVIFVCQMPAAAGVVCWIDFGLVNGGGVLGIEEHEDLWVGAIPVIDEFRRVVGDIEQPSERLHQ